MSHLLTWVILVVALVSYHRIQRNDLRLRDHLIEIYFITAVLGFHFLVDCAL